ncbi:ABC transporter permease [Pedobacter metabolipauper]|uniref:Putative ABC transport system permease protein n=1 Tax=Pedobacter metabolipauper TaxID=425513 RepID=A0A4R6SW64_9SPHI|nr:ABC transporter permease [Pedobacter metabolipauper]TDQ08362.1 putative ABC transport system permease protein [Pedobacter metabolipauper]
MFKLNLKIALRNLWKNGGITSINVGGLAIALAAFILVMMYVTYETTFDKGNPNYDNIYIVGRTMPEFKTNYTPPPLGKAIKQNFPEVMAVGTLKKGGFEFAISSDANTAFASNYLMVDYEAAKMLQLLPNEELAKPANEEGILFFLAKESMMTLFPKKKDDKPELVTLGSKAAGQTAEVKGTISVNKHSNVTFDALSVRKELGKNENYGYNNYNTYIQVKSGTDIAALEQKINTLYKNELIKDGQDVSTDRYKQTTIFLDPLKNQHLKPMAGNNAAYKVLIALSVLAMLILLIACINFTNLSIAQATKRAKEVGVKKVLGVYRYQLTFQFLTEILMQCVVATILGLLIAELLMPKFNALFNVSLSIWSANNALLYQLPLILLAITFIAGIYPAMVLSGFKPSLVLKGNFQTSRNTYWLRNSLLIVQFSVAVIFITSLLIISTQLKYMRTQDVGFNANQVVYIKNIMMFSDPRVFEPVRQKIMRIPGIKSVTVATGIPDGSENGSNGYTVNGVEASIDFLDVDFDYFETLDIKLADGRFFNKAFKTDTANSAIINESAAAKYGLTDPIGKTIRGCSMDYKIVGVVKDFKAQGFETPVQPTLYSIKNPCGNAKTQLMLKIDQDQMSEAIATLKAQWPDINKMDGDNFRYYFLNDLYGKLFQKQEQLQSVFFAAALLTIFIATLGLFAFAKYMTNNRMKEIAVRKVLGASDVQILKLLNSSFFAMVIIANCISWPLAYVLTKKWLETFAYRIDIPVLPFLISAAVTILLTVLTVSIQAAKAVKANPVNALKYE